MVNKNEFPVLEFDDDTDSVVNPFRWNLEPFSTDKLIITFFPDVMENLKKNDFSVNTDRFQKDRNRLFLFEISKQFAV